MDISLSQPQAASRHARYPAVDVLRGWAIIGVVLFHVVWDLAFLGMIPAQWAVHPAWIAFGRTVAATFMLLVGVSLALAARGGLDPGAFGARLAKIAAAALTITLATRLTMPGAYVYFGILHAIVVASLIGAAFLRAPSIVAFLLGGAIVAFGLAWTDPAFDARLVAWIGFAAVPSPSVDFAPVFPWAGFTLIGLAVTRAALHRGWLDRLPRPEGRLARGMALTGRRTLTIYLLHQPILLAILYPVVMLAG
ncbi:heparan-alpha-glucosaminide N-acetyltransferase [uncultured Jannaschia sp.]|uniref:heparan-alpha-glucosaminide N-acetyltransferase n=1 Tax=uncultured Jannaschia sp. TaxID=293347 RepID=UPI00261D03CD|nr:heparan-alpha-glucosaminide N-acetyltransferase [uncultured Jannaschia sp.]